MTDRQIKAMAEAIALAGTEYLPQSRIEVTEYKP